MIRRGQTSKGEGLCLFASRNQNRRASARQKVNTMHEVIIDCTDGGKVKATVKGLKGKACLKATEGLDKALGTKGKLTTTSEYNEKEQQRNHNSR